MTSSNWVQTTRRASSLRDCDGVIHEALIPNTDKADWTPIRCGEGIVYPGPQTDEAVTCPECLRRTSPVPPDQKDPSDG